MNDDQVIIDEADTMNDNNDFLDNEEVTKVGDGDNQTIQDFLKQKSELRDLAHFAVDQLSKKNKFNRKDIIRSFNKTLQFLDYVDSFIELIVSDLSIIDGRFKGLEENLFKVGQQQSVLVTALKTSNLLTDEQMLDAWNNIVKPSIENKIAEMNKAATESQPAVNTTATTEVPTPEANG